MWSESLKLFFPTYFLTKSFPRLELAVANVRRRNWDWKYNHHYSCRGIEEYHLHMIKAFLHFLNFSRETTELLECSHAEEIWNNNQLQTLCNWNNCQILFLIPPVPLEVSAKQFVMICKLSRLLCSRLTKPKLSFPWEICWNSNTQISSYWEIYQISIFTRCLQ